MSLTSPALGLTAAVTFQAGAVSTLSFSTQPSSTGDADSNLSTQPVVRAYDANSNLVTGYASPVTLRGYSDTNCTTEVTSSIQATSNPVSASSGTATFAAVRILKTNVIRIGASDGTRSACSNAITVSPGAPNQIAIESGNTQSGTAGSPLAGNLQVNVKDANGNLVPNAQVNWAVASGGGSLSAASSNTNSSGIASITWTLGTTAGANTATATIHGTSTSVTFSATGTAGAASTIAVSSGNSQSAAWNSALTNPIVALVRDANNNPVSGVTVNWAIASGGGSLGSASSTTNSSGLASTTWTLGNAGSNTATATINGTSTSETFSATATTTAFTSTWSFAAADAASYDYLTSKIDFTGGVCRLTGADRVDDDNTSSGFGGATLTGASWNASGYVELGSGNSCDGTTNPCASQSAPNFYELHSSWTPRWASIQGYWKFNNSLADSSGLGRTGTTVSTGFSTTAKLGSHAATFIADDTSATNERIIVPNATGLDSANTLSVAFWMKAASTTEAFAYIVHKGFTGGVGGGRWVIQRNNTTGTLRIIVGTAASGTPYADQGFAGSNSTFFDNTWKHVVVTFEPNSVITPTSVTVRVYLNGSLDSSGSVITDAAGFASTQGLYVGSHSASITTRELVGQIDDLAVWNVALTADEIRTLYRKQTINSGVVLSRVMDAQSTGQNWTSLSWTGSLPFLKELPDANCTPVSPATTCAHANSETSTHYPSLVGSNGSTTDNNLMSGIRVLYHLNGTPGTISDGAEITDHSGNFIHGTVVDGDGTNTIAYAEGRFQQGIQLDGVNDYITLPAATAVMPTTNSTLSLWIKPTSASDTGNIFAMGPTSGCATVGTRMSVDGARIRVDVGCASNFNSGQVLRLGEWNHVVLTIDASEVMSLFVNGTLRAGPTDLSINTGTLVNYTLSSANTVFGVRLGGSNPLNGALDEVAIWSRVLHATEIQQLYQRGSNRLLHQVRVCTAADCSDDASNSNWKGPDGTPNTFFSELFSKATQAASPSGAVLPSLPTMLFSNFTSPVGTSRYFQYRTILESYDTTSSPQLRSVTIAPVHYDSTSPTVIGKTGASYYSLSSFAQTVGSGCSSGITYNIGRGATWDVATWYYWNGTTWAVSNGTSAQSNSATVINTQASSFGTQLGTGTVFFKAYLNSSGTTPCELDQLVLQGQQ